MKKKLKFGFLFMFAIFMISCGGDDGVDAAENGIFTAKIDGVDFIGTTVSKGQILQSNSLQTQRFDINGSNGINRFLVAIESPQLTDCMPVTNYTGDNVLIFFEYKTSGGNYVMEHFHEDNTGRTTARVTITSCVGNKISGTFSGTFYKTGSVQNEFVTPDVVEVTNGVFKNIEFVVIRG